MPRLPVAPFTIDPSLYHFDACEPETGLRELSIDDSVIAQHAELSAMVGHILTRGKDLRVGGRHRSYPLNSDWVKVDVGEDLPASMEVGIRIESPSASTHIAKFWEERPSILVAGALCPRAGTADKPGVEVRNSRVIALMGVPVLFGAGEEVRQAYGVTTELAPSAELPGALAVDSSTFEEIRDTLQLLKRGHDKKGDPRLEPVGAEPDLLM